MTGNEITRFALLVLIGLIFVLITYMLLFNWSKDELVRVKSNKKNDKSKSKKSPYSSEFSFGGSREHAEKEKEKEEADSLTEVESTAKPAVDESADSNKVESKEAASLPQTGSESKPGVSAEDSKEVKSIEVSINTPEDKNFEPTTVERATPQLEDKVEGIDEIVEEAIEEVHSGHAKPGINMAKSSEPTTSLEDSETISEIVEEAIEEIHEEDLSKAEDLELDFEEIPESITNITLQPEPQQQYTPKAQPQQAVRPQYTPKQQPQPHHLIQYADITPPVVMHNELAVASNDLTAILGIDQHVAVLLNAADIHSYQDLAKARITHLSNALKVPDEEFAARRPETWSLQASLAASNNKAALKDLQNTLLNGGL